MQTHDGEKIVEGQAATARENEEVSGCRSCSRGETVAELHEAGASRALGKPGSGKRVGRGPGGEAHKKWEVREGKEPRWRGGEKEIGHTRVATVSCHERKPRCPNEPDEKARTRSK